MVGGYERTVVVLLVVQRLLDLRGRILEVEQSLWFLLFSAFLYKRGRDVWNHDLLSRPTRVIVL